MTNVGDQRPAHPFEQLHRVVGAVAGHEGPVTSVVLVGEPGCGKSTALRSFAAGLHVPVGMGRSAGPGLTEWAEAIRGLAQRGHGAGRAEVVLDLLARGNAGTDALGAAVSAFLGDEPCVLILDQMDEASAASWELVEAVAARLPGRAAGLLVAARHVPEQGAPATPAVLELLVDRERVLSAFRLELDELEPEVRAAVIHASAANPRALGALLRADRGALGGRDRAFLAALVAFRGAEIGSLRVTKALATFGRAVSPALLAESTGTSIGDALAELEAAERVGLVQTVPAGRAVSHPALRAALMELCTSIERTTIHRSIAEALSRAQRPGVGVDELHEAARHALEGGGSDEAVVDICRRAALAHETAGDLELAAALLDQVRMLEVPDALGPHVYRDLGRIEGRRGDVRRSRACFAEALERAELHGDDELVADILVDQALTEWHLDRHLVHQATMIRAAVERLGDRRPELQAVLLGRLTDLLYLTARDETADTAARAVRLAQRSGDQEAVDYVATRLAVLDGQLGIDAPPATARLDRITSTPRAEVVRLIPETMLRLSIGNRADLDDVRDKAVAAMRNHPLARWRSHVDVLEANVLFHDADEGALRDTLDRLLAQCLDLSAPGGFLAFASDAMWRLHTGRALGLVAPPEGCRPVTGLHAQLIAFTELTLGVELGERSRDDHLAFALQAVLQLPPNWTSDLCTAMAARMAPAANDAGSARRAVTRLRHRAGDFALVGGVLMAAPIGWYLADTQAWLGDHAGARASAVAAVGAARRVGSRPWLASTLVQWARVHQGSGDDAGVADALAEAERIASSFRLDAVLAAVDRFGRDPSTGASSADVGNPDLLRLVSSGLSNKQIARELTLSVKSVERLLSAEYRRLGVRNRAEATAVFMRTRR